MMFSGFDNETEPVVAGVLITAGGNAVRCATAGLGDMQRAVGGSFEPVDVAIAGHECTIWLDEEGKMKPLLPNLAASTMALDQRRIMVGDQIMGDVLVTGGVGIEGETLSLHPEAAAEIMKGAKK